MNKLGTKLGAIAMSAVMALTFAPSAAITSLAASGDGLLDATLGVEAVERLYNPYSGEHLFTTEDKEISDLVKLGWNDEGVAWKAPLVDGVPVYRLYNPNSGDHHYTTSLDERVKNLQQGWVNDNDGKAVFYGAESADPDAIPVYRLYNPNEATGTHHYTTDADEKAKCLASGWTDENSTFSGYPSDYEPEKPVEELKVSINNPTPKVGDTLTATYLPLDATIVSYVWSVSDDGEEWTVVDDEDDETFGVTEDYLGQYIMVTIIDSEANTASDVTDEPVDEAGEIGDIEIVSAEAVKANQIEVTLENPVITSDTTITLAKGTNTIDVTAKWGDTFDSVTLTTPTNMTAGEYTVTLASKTDATNTDSADFEVEEGQKVTSIVILNETALTNKDKINGIAGTEHTQAYAYYDVLDQYGESMRTSTSIQWTGSADVKANKATGQLTLTKSGTEAAGSKAWVYNEKIYLTGVYTKEGVVASAELTVGTEQALDTIEVAGFVKKNTTKLEKTLPADFKDGEWFLLFNAFDQNGNPMEAGGITDDDVNIISREPIIIEQVKGVEKNTVTIDGVEYNAINVKPGLKVADGGDVTIEAIATRTGNKTEYHCIVGVDQVITSFTMSAPAATVADGDKGVEIPFVALDEDGNEVTDFVTIAKHKTFNALTLSVGGDGDLTLKEENDGSAKLIYNDEAIGWNDSSATDGQQRPVSLTAVVVGGGSDNMMLGIDDKRRPEAIKDVNIAGVYFEGDEIGLSLDKKNISFYDQYGADMDGLWKAGTITTYDNGFFNADSYAGSTDFAGWVFSVKATYTGNAGLYTGDTYTTRVATKSALILPNGNTVAAAIQSGNLGVKSYAATNIVNNLAGESLKFEIVKAKTGDCATLDKFESTSRAKTKTFTVIDIKAVKNLKISSLGTVYLGTGVTASGSAITADGKIGSGDALNALKGDTPVAFNPGTGGIGATTTFATANDYEKAAEVKVKGTYNGTEVTVPARYFAVAGSKVKAGHVLNDGNTKVYLDTILPYGIDNPTSGLSIQDLYDKTTSEGVSKIAKDTIQASIYDLYTNATTATTGAITVTKAWNDVINTASLEVELSDQDSKATSFSNFKDAYTLNPTNTDLTTPAVFTWTTWKSNGFKELPEEKVVNVKDQYGVTIADALTYASVGGVTTVTANNVNMSVSNVEENKNGYVENNFEFTNNGKPGLTVKGGERADTFTLTLEYQGATASSAITVGADTNAKIDKNGNGYLGDGVNTGLKTELEKQRKQLLGI